MRYANKRVDKAEIIAGILSIEPGDLIFFYVKNKGVYGLWKAVGNPYYDETKIWLKDNQLYPYRVSFEPAIAYFPEPVLLNDILDLHDKGIIWTFDLNPVLQKNQYKITMDEARDLLRLLLRNNPIRLPLRVASNPYLPSYRQPIEIDYSGSQSIKFKYEGWLNAWFVEALSRSELKPLLGDYREFINLVPTTFNKVMDIFLTHVTNIDGIEVLHKYTCIELKVDRADEQDLAQILRYEDWLSRKLASGDHDMVQCILVASRFSDNLVHYLGNRRRIEEKIVRLIAYQVGNQNVELQEVLL